MGLLDTLRNALGLQRPLVPRDPNAPLTVTDAARAWLEAVPPGHGLHLATRALDPGWTVQVQEGPSQGPPPPELEPLPITAGNVDLHRLRGLILDRRDDRWAVSVDLDLRARETPNPNGRQYLCDRWLATGRSMVFTTAEGSPWLARALLGIPGVRSVLIRDNTLTVERELDVPWDRLDRAVDAALRQYFLQCGHELTPDDLPGRDDPFEDEVMRVLEQSIIPAIHRDGGDLELVGISGGVVTVSMHGACRSCPSSTATLRLGVERALKEAFPGRIDRVEQV